MSLPTILVVNDDGIFAPGIRALVSVAKEFGHVVVVAPDSPQSAKGHSISINEILRLRKIRHTTRLPNCLAKLAFNPSKY